MADEGGLMGVSERGMKVRVKLEKTWGICCIKGFREFMPEVPGAS